MKWAKRFGIVMLSFPIALAVAWVLYEIFGVCVNHIATNEQTNTLQTNLESEISDIRIISVYSETGNTSGTGNHIDCLSYIIFSTEMQEAEIEDCMSKYHVFDGWFGWGVDIPDDWTGFHADMRDYTAKHGCIVKRKPKSSF